MGGMAERVLRITYVTLKLHSHGPDFGMKWVNLNERMTIGKSHLGFTVREDPKGQEFGCGY